MSFRAVILLKNREAATIKADATKTHFKFGGGIYIISVKDIQNHERNKKISGAEAMYFEGNPNAIGYEVMADTSGKYLNEIVTMNALKQTASGPKFDFGNMFGFLKPLTDPVNLVYVLFVGVIVYGILAPVFGWV